MLSEITGSAPTGLFSGILLAPPRQHTAFQLHRVRKTLCPQQPDRGYAAVGTQANGDYCPLLVELQRGDTAFEFVDRHTDGAGQE